MKKALLWIAEHWALIPLTAFCVMAILSFAGVKPAQDANRFFVEKEYDGSGLVWQETPESTCFAAVGYDDGYERLALIFRSNETRTYVYSEILAKDFDDFIHSDSLGSYYNKHIKGEYPCERIDETEGTFYRP